jgi:hypothetical protein
MYHIGSELYTKDELLTIINQYNKTHGQFITQANTNLLPREVSEHIIQYLPYYPTIVKNPYQNITTYQNMYCTLPLTFEVVKKFIESQDDYKIYMFIVYKNKFIIDYVYIKNYKISSVKITTITKKHKKINFNYLNYDWRQKFTFDHLEETMSQYNVIFDIETTFRIFKSYQCYQYIDVSNIIKSQINTYFSKRKPANEHIDQLFYNVKSNIFIHINKHKNDNYFDTDILAFPVASARFDDNGYFIDWEWGDIDQEEIYEHNWFIDEKNPKKTFNKLIEKYNI